MSMTTAHVRQEQLASNARYLLLLYPPMKLILLPCIRNYWLGESCSCFAELPILARAMLTEQCEGVDSKNAMNSTE